MSPKKKTENIRNAKDHPNKENNKKDQKRISVSLSILNKADQDEKKAE